MKLLFEILLILITLAIGFFIGWMAHQAAKKAMLETGSGQREKLFELAAKDTMTVKDIYLLRAAVRFSKNDGTQELYSFGFMTNQIIDFCDEMLSTYENGDSASTQSGEITNSLDREIIRTYARYLLEDQEEGLSIKKYFDKKDYLTKEMEIGSETYDRVELLNEQKIDNQIYKSTPQNPAEKKNNEEITGTKIIRKQEKPATPKNSFWTSTTGIVTSLSLVSGSAYLIKSAITNKMFRRKKEKSEV